MEVRINREIREYTESMYFGLSMRQFIFSVLALAASVLAYFILKPILGTELVSWVCILAAVPFAILGFVRYNGMPAEQFIAAFVKSEILVPRQLSFGPSNLYMEAIMAAREDKKRRKRKPKHMKGGRP